LFPDAGHQSLEIPAGKVCSSNPRFENYIAAKANLRQGDIKDHMARGMTGGMTHLDFVTAYVENLPVFEPEAGLRGRFELKAKQLRAALYIPQREIPRV